MRELPVLDASRCTGCGECVAVCPVGCLSLGRPGPWLIRPADCVACGACKFLCPVDALRIEPVPRA